MCKNCQGGRENEIELLHVLWLTLDCDCCWGGQVSNGCFCTSSVSTYRYARQTWRPSMDFGTVVLPDAVSNLRPRGVKCRFREPSKGTVTELWLFSKKKSTSKKWKRKSNNKSVHLQATEQPWGQNLHSGRQYLRQLWAKVRKIFCWLQSWCQIDKFKQQSFVNSHFTGSSSETKRKEESSEEEESRKEAYSKAQSMKSLFQQGQTMAAKRYKRPNNKTIS